MARRVHSIYDWRGDELERVGAISDAKLRAWEYHADGDARWELDSGEGRDTVRRWKSARPDLAPDTLLVGDLET